MIDKSLIGKIISICICDNGDPISTALYVIINQIDSDVCYAQLTRTKSTLYTLLDSKEISWKDDFGAVSDLYIGGIGISDVKSFAKDIYQDMVIVGTIDDKRLTMLQTAAQEKYLLDKEAIAQEKNNATHHSNYF